MSHSSTTNDAIDRFAPAQPDGRRAFLTAIGCEVLGATAIAAGLGGSERVEAALGRSPPSADVFLGKSAADQPAGHVIESPLYFMNGDPAGAFHTLDVSTWRMSGVVSGLVTSGADTIAPDFSTSVAAAITHGSDGELYFVVAAEGTVTDGTGVFSNVTKAILRGKYKATVDATGNPLLHACADCVILLTHG